MWAGACDIGCSTYRMFFFFCQWLFCPHRCFTTDHTDTLISILGLFFYFMNTLILLSHSQLASIHSYSDINLRKIKKKRKHKVKTKCHFQETKWLIIKYWKVSNQVSLATTVRNLAITQLFSFEVGLHFYLLETIIRTQFSAKPCHVSKNFILIPVQSWS